MPSRLLAALAMLLASAALSGDARSAGVPGAAETAGPPIVYGYPYADRCPGAGLADVVDRWGMYACNCTSFVAWALSANHQRIDWFIRGSMDAWNWPNVARIGRLTVDRTPTVGAVAVWPNIARPFGHVAYVMGISADRTIDVAEYNFPGPYGSETFGFETRTFLRAGGAVFIHVPRRALSRAGPAGPRP
jgi:surface antigen